MPLEEAEKARATWFALYPEIRFWQLWTWLTKAGGEHWLGEARRGGAIGARKRPVYRVSTLAGREFVVVKPTEALNFQDQATGSDIIMLAVAKLREAGLLRLVADQIHDELLLVVPAPEAENVAARLERIMVEAGDEILSPYGVPVEVEIAREEGGSIPTYWKH